MSVGGLGKKAKTSQEIVFEYNEYGREKDEKLTKDAQKLKREILEAKWVRVADAEADKKETVDKLQQELGLANEELKRARILLEDMQMERGVLKQKLKELLRKFPVNIREVEQEHERTVKVYTLGSKVEIIAWLKEFEGLFAGAEETKPE